MRSDVVATNTVFTAAMLRLERNLHVTGTSRQDHRYWATWGLLAWLGLPALVTPSLAATVGFQSASQEILVPFGQNDFEVGDLNGDGHLDLTVTANGETRFYVNDGAGSFSFETRLFTELEVADVSLFDIDRDSDLDAWVWDPQGGVSIWLNEPDEGLVRSEFDLVRPGRGPLLVADLDFDQDSDVILADVGLDTFESVAGEGGHILWFNGGDGQFGDPIRIPAANSEGPLPGLGGVLADLDLDGDVDFIGTYADHTARVWLNASSRGLIESGSPWAAGGAPEIAAVARIVLGDFDADGDLDAVRPVAQGQNEYWVNEGGGEFTRMEEGLGPVQGALASGDLDNDGGTDLVAAGEPCDDCTQVWLLRNGGLAANPIKIFRGNTTVRRVQLSDLDSDGDLDVVGLVDVIEAPAGRSFVGVWFNSLINRAVNPGVLGAITDSTLGLVIRDRLGLPPDLSVTPNYNGFTSLSLTREQFSPAFNPIRSLEGLEDAHDLEILRLQGVVDRSRNDGVLDLSFLDRLPKLRVLDLRGNGLRGLVLPSLAPSLEEMYLDGNLLGNFVVHGLFPQLRVLSLARNNLESLTIADTATPRLVTLDLRQNPLLELKFRAGIPSLLPSVESLRTTGARVTVNTRLTALRFNDAGQPQLNFFSDMGRFQVRRSMDFSVWEPIGEVRVELSNTRIVSFTDESADGIQAAFYSIVRLEP